MIFTLNIYLSRKKNIKIVWVPNNYTLGIKLIKDCRTQKKGLFKLNVKGKKLNDLYLQMFPII